MAPFFTKSVACRMIGLGFVAVFVLSLGTDQVLHVLKVYPPWDQPMREPGPVFLAFAYRIVYGVLGSYITASLAPYSPMRHVWIGGFIGLALSTVGAIVTIPMDLGPTWYPIALVVTALPCAFQFSSGPPISVSSTSDFASSADIFSGSFRP
jgi:hypothetical protein